MLLDLEKKVAEFVEANKELAAAGKILLAVSGGADSTALLYAMSSLKTEGILKGEISAFHFNHQLRGAESDGDERFVVEQAGKLGVTVKTKRGDVQKFAAKNKLSIETAARKLRIESLIEVAKENNCRFVTTAHHAGDNAETVLHRLIRGTGFRGLGGIRPKREFDGIWFVRPMLEVGRSDIIEYLENRRLSWRIDRTNEDCKYTRNFIRHKLIAELQKQCEGSLEKQLSELARAARGFYDLVCNCADEIWPKAADCRGGKVVLDLKVFSRQQPEVRIELVRRSLRMLGSGEGDWSQGHFEKMLRLAKGDKSGREIELPGGFAVEFEYGKLIFTSREKVETEKIESSVIEVPGQMRFGDYLIETSIVEAKECDIEKFKNEKTNLVEWFNLDKVSLPLEVRGRREGDRFVPLGQGQEKRVGKFLTDARVPREIRKKVLIVADSEKIIWVWPVRMSEWAKVTAGSRKILQIQIK
jgi:tRNA(Ile)-lysidine synthase